MADHENRAYSLLEVKQFDDEKRIITGIATTPTPDRMGDIVEPLGVKFADSVPAFLHHDARLVVGRAKFGKPTKAGIPFEMHLPRIDEPGRLKDRVDEAWQSVKYGLIAAVSIGFGVLKYEILKEGGLRFTETEMLELSLVPIPANPQAVITAFKSADPSARQGALDLLRKSVGKGQAATGQNPDPNTSPPGVSGTATKPATSGLFSFHKGNTVKTIADQIADFIAKRAAVEAQANNLMTKAAEAGVTLDAQQEDEYDTAMAEVESIDKHLARLRRLESAQVGQAKPVVGKSQDEGSNSRGPTIIVRKNDKEDAFEGQSFVRKMIAQAIAKDTGVSASAVAKHRWGQTNPQLVDVIRANEVAGGGAGAGEWGNELVNANNTYTGDFIEYLYAKTLFDNLGLTEIPANVRIGGQDGAATAYWTGESKAIAASAMDFSAVSLTPLKVAALAVISNEIIRDSSPSAEMLVRNGLVNASAQKIDSTFFGTAAAVAGVSPAGILNGLTAITATGTTADHLRADVKSLYAPFIAAFNASDLEFALNPSLAKSISLMTNALGAAEFAGLTTAGGSLLGDKANTGNNVGAGHLILLKPSDIYRIGNTGVEVSMSQQATIEMSSAPTGATDTPAAATQVLNNMFQTESTAFKVVRSVNWAKRRASAVAYVSGAAYSA